MLALSGPCFLVAGFIPHGHCYLWNPGLVRLHLISDALIALAYYSIPVTLFYFVQKRRDLPFNWMFLLFGIFIIACGTTHLMEIWTIWHPSYWLSGGVKFLTASISLYATVLLLPLVPKALALPSPTQLAAMNQELEREIAERRQAEEQLRRSEARFRAIFEQAAVGICETDVSGRFIRANQRFCQIVGYSEPEILELTYQELTHPEDQAAELEQATLLLSGAIQTCSFEKRYVCKNGQPCWINIAGSLVRDESGTPQYFIGVIEDIQNRKEIEAALRESEARFRRLAANVPGVIYQALHPQGNGLGQLTYVSPSVRDFFEVEPELLQQGEGGLDFLIHPNDLDGLRNTVTTATQTLRPLKWEGRLVLPSGQLKWVQAASRPEKQLNGDIICDGMIIDISDRKQAEATLQNLNTHLEDQVKARTAELRLAIEAEATLTRIIERVRDSLDETQILQTAVQELAQGLNLGSCNAALFDLQQGTSTIYYEHTTTVPPSEKRVSLIADFLELYKPLLQGQYFQFCSLLPHEVRGQVAILTYPIRDDQGVLGSLWLTRQSHDLFNDQNIRLVQQVASQCAIALRQSRLYQSAQTQVGELARLNRLKDDFLSTVSHELRTPMTNIKMATQMLELALKSSGMLDGSSGRVERYLEILKKGCESEINLIENLLNLSRLEVETQQLNLTTISDLSAWIIPLIKPFRTQISSQQQTLQLDIPLELPPITTDISRLGPILEELLTNACKYTPPNEAIVVSARTTVEALELSVSNSGVEIPAAEWDQIFDKFYRVPNNDPWKYGGTGLGLALVKQWVRQIQGTILVHSEPGWSTFLVRLPWVVQQI